jgi:DNA-binding winged helix-turn-helix (wHTH) protein/tetratricopeptide (TPR) repeat protein
MAKRADCIAFDRFVLDPRDERVVGPEGPVKLGNKAYRLLVTLIENEGRLVTKDDLLSTVWKGTIVTEASLTSAVRELRRALGDGSRTPRLIESVYGRGYRFIAPVHPAEAVSPPPAPAPRSAAPASDGRPPLVLVSAFRDEAVQASHPFFAAELREEVLSGLSRFREIQLVADNRPEEEAAQAHRSERGYQLTATLVPEGDGVKVIARARRLSDGRVLWAETMSLADTGTAGGVEKIVRRIAGAAVPAVDEDLYLDLPRESDDIYNRFLVAKRQSFSARNFAEARDAAAALESIIAERPGFALAFPPLARLYNTDFAYTALGSSRPAERARALQLARDGLAADRGNAHAYTVLGFCHLRHHQRDLARECFETASILNPYNPGRLNEVATGMMWLGDFERARSLYEFSQSLHPFMDDLLLEDFAQLALFEGRPDEALTHVRKMSGPRLWAGLYEALAEHLVGIPTSLSKLADWRKEARSRWHDGDPPSQAAFEEWIELHHPLAPEPRREFVRLVHSLFALVDEDSRPAEAHAPADPVPQRS